MTLDEERSALPVADRSLVRRAFLAHPQAIGETYGAHLAAAFAIAMRLLGAGAACLVHGFLPILFQERASRTVVSLHEEFVRRGLACDVDAPESERARENVD